MARWAAVLVLAATAVAMASVAGGDMSADKTECADQLVGLAPCLQYVQGQARAPPPDCCGGLRQVLGKSRVPVRACQGQGRPRPGHQDQRHPRARPPQRLRRHPRQRLPLRS